MALKLYLDDCSNSSQLADRLRQAGHDLTRPTDVGMDGADDAVHFAYAISQGAAIITKNSADFQTLHSDNPAHFGIFAVYQDNDPNRDMSDAEIVKAIGNVEAASLAGGDPIPGHFHILNNWRF